MGGVTNGVSVVTDRVQYMTTPDIPVEGCTRVGEEPTPGVPGHPVSPVHGLFTTGSWERVQRTLRVVEEGGKWGVLDCHETVDLVDENQWVELNSVLAEAWDGGRDRRDATELHFMGTEAGTVPTKKRRRRGSLQTGRMFLYTSWEVGLVH